MALKPFDRNIRTAEKQKTPQYRSSPSNGVVIFSPTDGNTIWFDTKITEIQLYQNYEITFNTIRASATSGSIVRVDLIIKTGSAPEAVAERYTSVTQTNLIPGEGTQLIIPGPDPNQGEEFSQRLGVQFDSGSSNYVVYANYTISPVDYYQTFLFQE